MLDQLRELEPTTPRVKAKFSHQLIREREHPVSLLAEACRREAAIQPQSR
ncbi:MAG: hypothetical protein ACLFUF_01800 [Opitutales bacterium]